MPPFGNEPDWTTPGDTSNVTAPAQSTTVGGVNASVGGGGGGGGATGGGGGGGGGFSNDRYECGKSKKDFTVVCLCVVGYL